MSTKDTELDLSKNFEAILLGASTPEHATREINKLHKATLDKAVKEAYKKGFIDGGRDQLTKEEQ